MFKKDKRKIPFDKYELGMIINALNDLRTKQIKEEQPTDPIDELMMKMINELEHIKE